MRFLLAIALLLPLSAFGREGPDNIIYVTAATSGNSICNAPDNDPYTCCNNPAADTCDTTLNGADICAGLEQCEDAGGCRLQLPQGTIVEGEHFIYGTPYWTLGPTTPCGGNFGNGEGGFPNGLIVQGKGMDQTFIEASVPARSASGVDSYKIVAIAAGGGLNANEVPRIVYQDLTLDGLSNKQPVSPVASKGQIGLTLNARNDQAWSQEKIPLFVFRDARIQRTVSALFESGSVNTPASIAGTGRIDGNVHILRSVLSKSGCHQPHNRGTTHAGAFACGCDADSPGSDCSGWNDYSFRCTGLNTPYACCEDNLKGNNTEPGMCCSCGDCAACPGTRSDGAGFNGLIMSNLLIAKSFIEKAPHFLIGTNTTTNSGWGPCQTSWAEANSLCTANVTPFPCCTGLDTGTCPGYDVFSPEKCGKGYHVHGNRFGEVGAGSIDAHGGWDIRFTENTFEGQCYDDNYGISECGDVSFANGFVHWVYFRGNRFLGNESSNGMEYNWWRPIEGVDVPLAGQSYHAPRNVFQDETYELDCGRCGTTPTLICSPADARAGTTDQIAGMMGTYSARLPPTDFINLQFTDSGTNNCTASLYMRPGAATTGFEDNYGCESSGNPWPCCTGLNTGNCNLKGIHEAVIRDSTFRAGGRDGPSDGWGIPGSPDARRAVAYFNYLFNSRIENSIAIGTGSTGKVTFGRQGTLDDLMDGSCYGITLQSGASINERSTDVVTPCP